MSCGTGATSRKRLVVKHAAPRALRAWDGSRNREIFFFVVFILLFFLYSFSFFRGFAGASLLFLRVLGGCGLIFLELRMVDCVPGLSVMPAQIGLEVGPGLRAIQKRRAGPWEVRVGAGKRSERVGNRSKDATATSKDDHRTGFDRDEPKKGAFPPQLRCPQIDRGRNGSCGELPSTFASYLVMSRSRPDLGLRSELATANPGQGVGWALIHLRESRLGEAYGGAECGDAAESHPCTPGDACASAKGGNYQGRSGRLQPSR